MSRTPSTVGLGLATLLGAALVGLGGAFAFRPDLILESAPALRALLESIDPGLVVLALVALLVVLAPTLGIAGRLRSSPPPRLVTTDSANETGTRGDRPPSRSAGPSHRRPVGAAVDERIDLATAYDDEPRDIREAARERLLESLRSIAATTYANRAGCSAAEATAAIDSGTWTDDPRAGAFLAGDDGPSTPLWLWLFDLASGADPLERQLDATVAELEALRSATTIAGPPRAADTAPDSGVRTDTEPAAVAQDDEEAEVPA